MKTSPVSIAIGFDPAFAVPTRLMPLTQIGWLSISFRPSPCLCALPMQMHSARRTGIAHTADDLANFHAVARLHTDAAIFEVTVKRGLAIAMIDQDIIAIG